MFSAKPRASIHSSIYLFSLKDIDWVLTCVNTARNTTDIIMNEALAPLSITKECIDYLFACFPTPEGSSLILSYSSKSSSLYCEVFLDLTQFLKKTFPPDVYFIKIYLSIFSIAGVSFSASLPPLHSFTSIHLFFLAFFLPPKNDM